MCCNQLFICPSQHTSRLAAQVIRSPNPDQPQQAHRSFGAHSKAGSRAKPMAPRGPAGRQRMRCSRDRCLARLIWWHAMVLRSSSATRKRVGDVASSGYLLTLQLGDQAKHHQDRHSAERESPSCWPSACALRPLLFGSEVSVHLHLVCSQPQNHTWQERPPKTEVGMSGTLATPPPRRMPSPLAGLN